LTLSLDFIAVIFIVLLINLN